MRRLVLHLALGVLLGLTVGPIVAPTPAMAHDVLEKTTPGDGTTVEQLPGDVLLVFSQEPLEIGLQVIVTGPMGNVAQGPATIEGREVRQAVSSAAPAGEYTIAYRVTSDDGHPITGSFRFFARTGLDGSTATAGPSVPAPQALDPEVETAKESQFVPIVLTAAGSIIAIGLVGFVMLRLRHRAG
jgi:hypothetical protein